MRTQGSMHEDHNEVIRAVVFQEDDIWVGVCLEHYIGAQASTEDELLERLKVAIMAESHESCNRNGAPFAGIGPAPARYHQMWNENAMRDENDGGFKETLDDDYVVNRVRATLDDDHVSLAACHA